MKLPSWIAGFEQYTAKIGSPLLFRRWTGISLIAAALERKAWVWTSKGQLYPNTYIILVGPAGIGKTNAAKIGQQIMREALKDHHRAPTSTTKASLMDALRDAKRQDVNTLRDPPVIEFNSLYLISNELGVLVPAYESDFINVLTDLYDNLVYSERRRTKELNFEIKAPQLNFLAATTPSYLTGLLPEGAWDQGFISRTILIYDGRHVNVDLFTVLEKDNGLQEALIKGLEEIGKRYGEFTPDDDYVTAFRAWQAKNHEPKPSHPKLLHYTTRRETHLLKLSMIISASKRPNFKLTGEDFVEAISWLQDAEVNMNDIFKASITGGASSATRDAWHYAYEWYIREGKTPIPEANLIEYLTERVPVHDIMKIVDAMEKSTLLKEQILPSGGKGFIPRPPRR